MKYPTKIKPFINKYNWEEINLKKIIGKIEKNNLTMTVNVLYAKNEIMYLDYVKKKIFAILWCPLKTIKY